MTHLLCTPTESSRLQPPTSLPRLFNPGLTAELLPLSSRCWGLLILYLTLLPTAHVTMSPCHMFLRRPGWNTLADYASSLSLWSVVGWKCCLYRAGEPLAHPLSTASVTATTWVNTCRQRWPSSSNSSSSCLWNPYWNLLWHHSQLSVSSCSCRTWYSPSPWLLAIGLPLLFYPSPLVGPKSKPALEGSR